MAVGAAIVVPSAPVGALPWQEGDPSQVGAGGSTSSAQVDLEIDVNTADQTALVGTAETIQENVSAQMESLRNAELAVTQAQADVITAQAAIDATETEIDTLVLLSDQVVVQAFINPPAVQAIDLVTTESSRDISMKQALLTMQADADADVLTTLAERRQDLEDLRDQQAEAESTAEEARADTAVALADAQSAVSQQTSFLLAIEQRIDEGDTNLDPDLAAELGEQQDALAGMLTDIQVDAELAAAGVPLPGPEHVSGPSSITVNGGGLVDVSCPSGGEITVAGSISRSVQSILNLADQQGLVMCGGGWRGPEEQIALRQAHCGNTYYLIYEAPSSYCSPPTARPGTSMHERGLAVDFTCYGGTVRYGDSCHNLLETYGATHGLYQLPSESWHWSPNGE